MKLICELCEEKPAKYIMSNQVNGDKMKVCCCCYKELWGREDADRK